MLLLDLLDSFLCCKEEIRRDACRIQRNSKIKGEDWLITVKVGKPQKEVTPRLRLARELKNVFCARRFATTQWSGGLVVVLKMAVQLVSLPSNR
jgi:hypothetical protein